MQPDQKPEKGSLKGGESHRRDRAVHKIRLSELGDFSREEISEMVATGDIELMVRRTDIADLSEGGWSHRLEGLFDKIAGGLDRAPAHENRTIIVNIVSSGHSQR